MQQLAKRIAFAMSLVTIAVMLCSLGVSVGTAQAQIGEDRVKIEGLERRNAEEISVLSDIRRDIDWIKWRLGWRRDAP